MIWDFAQTVHIPRAVIGEAFIRPTKSVPRPLGSGPRWPLPNGRGTASVSSMTASGIVRQKTLIFREAERRRSK